MASRYGHAWSSQYGTSPTGLAGSEWAETLAGITRAQFDTGVRKDALRGADWPPSSSAFRRMCLGIPSLDVTLHDIRNPNPELAPFIALVWSYIDTFRLARANQGEAERIIAGAYRLACEHVMDGGALPEPRLAIEDAPPPPRKPAPPELAEAALANIETMLGP